jgi:uncharacterized membrane protein
MYLNRFRNPVGKKDDVLLLLILVAIEGIMDYMLQYQLQRLIDEQEKTNKLLQETNRKLDEMDRGADKGVRMASGISVLAIGVAIVGTFFTSSSSTSSPHFNILAALAAIACVFGGIILILISLWTN